MILLSLKLNKIPFIDNNLYFELYFCLNGEQEGPI